MSNRKTTAILLTSLLSLSSFSVFAAPPSQQEQLDQSRAQEAERQERLGEERAQVVMPPPPPSDLPADEGVRFRISHVTIEHQTERFRFLERLSRPYEGKELSLREINELVTAMNRTLMSR
ncbi:ShlB/FhaC/HecB family hemolysin secretion/activation protein, partial [Selenomonas noxia]